MLASASTPGLSTPAKKREARRRAREEAEAASPQEAAKPDWLRAAESRLGVAEAGEESPPARLSRWGGRRDAALPS